MEWRVFLPLPTPADADWVPAEMLREYEARLAELRLAVTGQALRGARGSGTERSDAYLCVDRADEAGRRFAGGGGEAAAAAASGERTVGRPVGVKMRAGAKLEVKVSVGEGAGGTQRREGRALFERIVELSAGWTPPEKAVEAQQWEKIKGGKPSRDKDLPVLLCKLAQKVMRSYPDVTDFSALPDDTPWISFSKSINKEVVQDWVVRELTDILVSLPQLDPAREEPSTAALTYRREWLSICVEGNEQSVFNHLCDPIWQPMWLAVKALDEIHQRRSAMAQRRQLSAIWGGYPEFVTHLRIADANGVAADAEERRVALDTSSAGARHSPSLPCSHPWPARSCARMRAGLRTALRGYSWRHSAFRYQTGGRSLRQLRAAKAAAGQLRDFASSTSTMGSDRWWGGRTDDNIGMVLQLEISKLLWAAHTSLFDHPEAATVLSVSTGMTLQALWAPLQQRRQCVQEPDARDLLLWIRDHGTSPRLREEAGPADSDGPQSAAHWLARHVCVDSVSEADQHYFDGMLLLLSWALLHERDSTEWAATLRWLRAMHATTGRESGENGQSSRHHQFEGLLALAAIRVGDVDRARASEAALMAAMNATNITWGSRLLGQALGFSAVLSGGDRSVFDWVTEHRIFGNIHVRELVQAATRAGDATMIKALAERGAPFVQEISVHAAHTAALQGRLELMEWLVEKAHSHFSSTTLHFTLAAGHLSVVRFLLETAPPARELPTWVLSAAAHTPGPDTYECVKLLLGRHPDNAQAPALIAAAKAANVNPRLLRLLAEHATDTVWDSVLTSPELHGDNEAMELLHFARYGSDPVRAPFE